MTGKNKKLNDMIFEMSNSDSAHQNSKKLFDLHKNNEELNEQIRQLLDENEALKRRMEEMNSYSFMQTNTN